MKLDLHTHSTASDGQYTPKELIHFAKEKDLTLFSLTDHDSVSGLSQSEEEAKKVNISFIPGIEISAQEDEEIHILGYGIDYLDKRIVEACEAFRADRDNRGERICSFLCSKGIEITMDNIRAIAGESNVGRPHFAKYLLDNGYVNERKEAFDIYLDTPEFFEATRRKKPSIQTSIELIHSVGGKAVLAHPSFIHKSSKALDEMVKDLKESGLDGIECFYSQHSKEQTNYYLKLAQKYNMKISCGSDFHGEKIKENVKIGMFFDEKKYGHLFIV